METNTTRQYTAAERTPAEVRVASLVVHAPSGPIVLPLEDAAVVIGRQAPSDIVVDDPSLSRQHARFLLTEDGLLVEDLESTNGTRVDGESIQKTLVRPGQVVEVGSVDISFHRRSPHSEPEAAPALETASPAMRQLDGWIARAAKVRSPVLVQGETGSGKERVAHALHTRGSRRTRPFKVINCAAIPDTLAEGLLFGHERGAFTGATTSQPGLFEQARGGTLFLDEVGELPSRIQAMLLRALETKRVARIGATSEVEVDVRIVAATHRDLDAMVHAGQFREDLLYRLNALTLRVPPLRERREEITGLAQRFLAEAATDWNGAATGFSAAASHALREYHWPGNIRQLRNVIERAMLVCRGSVIELGDLPVALRQPTPPPESPQGTSPRASVGPVANGAAMETFRERVQRFEAELLKEALIECQGNQRGASRRLGIPIRTLSNKIKAYGLRAYLDASVDGEE